MFLAQWVLCCASSISWEIFSKELVACFDDSFAINAYEAMHLTRQIGSLEDYLVLFEEWLAQLPSLPPKQYLGIFLGKLHPSNNDQLLDLEIANVLVAIRAVQRVARSSKPLTSPTQPTFSSNNFSQLTTTFKSPFLVMGSFLILPSYRSSQFNATRNSRCLIIAQQEEYPAKGKCFHCGG